jgi:hypothetical protein
MSLPFVGGPDSARLLAAMAVEHVADRQMDHARRATEDALLVVDGIKDTRTVGEVSLLLGEALVSLHEAHRAKERLEIAVESFDEIGAQAEAAKARFILARAMMLLRDPAARAVLEDAGTLFEELGDEEAVLAIDRALREVEADIAESPRSFCAGHRSSSCMKAVAPIK